MVLKFDIKKLEKEIAPFEVNVSQKVATGKLRDGRKYQVHLTITTEEDDFIEGDECVNVND